MDFLKSMQAFESHAFYNEDDVKLHFYAELFKPLREDLGLEDVPYQSEHRLHLGGRTDATFRNIDFEFKKFRHFRKESGVQEALYGRNDQDHGLYDYIVSSAEPSPTDDQASLERKLLKGIGVGFDGETFLFARFVPSPVKKPLRTEKLKIKLNAMVALDFEPKPMDFVSGLRRMAMLLRQEQRLTLNKHNLRSVITPKSPFVRESIRSLYQSLMFHLHGTDGSSQVRSLYKEWDLVFGTMYGEDKDATAFTEVSSVIRRLYGFQDDLEIDSKVYLFALQTFFNMFLKLLIYSFLSQLISPTFSIQGGLSKPDFDQLFDGRMDPYSSLVSNFFEPHFMEWFTYTDSDQSPGIINDVLKAVDQFDLNTYILKPEELQDILQEIYMELIPKEMRHLMGEYFSPDWIVERALDLAGYDGDIGKTLIDPTAGSGSFLTHAIKRVIRRQGGRLSRDDVDQIVQHIVGFDINPISVVSAKANYILAVFSACADEVFESFADPVEIPIYIADSILSPIVYSEESERTLSVNTSVGRFEIPKFDSLTAAGEFLQLLRQYACEYRGFTPFWEQIRGRLLDEEYQPVVLALYERMYKLCRAGKGAFWPTILRNSFAPILLGDKFDFVVGNPPWISWKSMSRSYRTGTLKIWQSYGIFEKSAYDKKTTHDDFGMAVTYVTVDKYLKENGQMVFLLPASFLKSTKGGEGFRKLSITRHGQNIPFAVDSVDDFSKVRLFTVPTVAVRFIKGVPMQYPLERYRVWRQTGRRSAFDSHAKWQQVEQQLTCETMLAQPVDGNDPQSAWLTMAGMDFAKRLLDPKPPRYYSGRKGIEPAGAKGVFLLKKPVRSRDGLLLIENCIERQRRKDFLTKGVHRGKIEETYVFPMLGGRNIAKWQIKSNEFILLPHTAEYKYGIPVRELERTAPKTARWLEFYHDELLDSRIQNGKFFNPRTQPYYRLDNVGEYTYAPYKVLWKEQTGSMSAVVVGSYYESIPNADRALFSADKPVVADSKVLTLSLQTAAEAHFVCGILNAADVVAVIDSYAVSTNRGLDVLKYLAIPPYAPENPAHAAIARFSQQIHAQMRQPVPGSVRPLEEALNQAVRQLFA